MRFNYKGRTVEYPDTAMFSDIASDIQKEYDARIILANVDQKLYELNKKVGLAESRNAEGDFLPVLKFYTTRDRDGHRAYERGAEMMFLRATTHLYGKKLKKLKLEYAIGDGLYFTVVFKDGCNIKLDAKTLGRIKAVMRKYVDNDEKFVKSKISTRGAVEIFRIHGMKDKERLFHYRRTSTTNMYRFGNYYDYYYGYMPPSAGYVDIFDLVPAGEGVLLVLPNHSAPEKIGSPYVAPKLFAAMNVSNTWGENIGIPTVAALNDAISRGEGKDIILSSEAYQEHIIGEFAQRIKEENRRIVMIAGPSSSGKTSFSHRLSIQLNNVGLKAHPIACDNYYLQRELTPKDENGEYDFECLEAINIDLFNRQMTSLLKGEKVELPTFNFKLGRPEYNGNSLKMGSDDVLVIEGIHGLNDKLSYSISPDDKFRIYISAITALNIDEHNRIPTTDSREIRRMVRDARTRGFSARETIARWQSVRQGEEKHIFPFQESADVMFNSASIYELAVLKTFAEPLLFAIPTDVPEYPEAKRLLKFFEYFLGLSCEDVPRNSLLREFIGGSIFPVG